MNNVIWRGENESDKMLRVFDGSVCFCRKNKRAGFLFERD